MSRFTVLGDYCLSSVYNPMGDYIRADLPLVTDLGGGVIFEGGYIRRGLYTDGYSSLS